MEMGDEGGNNVLQDLCHLHNYFISDIVGVAQLVNKVDGME